MVTTSAVRLNSRVRPNSTAVGFESDREAKKKERQRGRVIEKKKGETKKERKREGWGLWRKKEEEKKGREVKLRR